MAQCPRPTPKQHCQWTLGRLHPLSRGEESESNYLNCPEGPESREPAVDCRRQVARLFGERLQPLSDLQLSVCSIRLHPSTFPCLASHVQTAGHTLRKLGQQCRDHRPLKLQTLQMKGPCHPGFMEDKLFHSWGPTKG